MTTQPKLDQTIFYPKYFKFAISASIFSSIKVGVNCLGKFALASFYGNNAINLNNYIFKLLIFHFDVFSE